MPRTPAWRCPPIRRLPVAVAVVVLDVINLLGVTLCQPCIPPHYTPLPHYLPDRERSWFRDCDRGWFLCNDLDNTTYPLPTHLVRLIARCRNRGGGTGLDVTLWVTPDITAGRCSPRLFALNLPLCGLPVRTVGLVAERHHIYCCQALVAHLPQLRLPPAVRQR